MSRLTRFALAGVLALVALPASGQGGGEPTSRTVTVPLPNGPGVFYYRSGGDSSGVRIRSRTVTAPALEDERPDLEADIRAAERSGDSVALEALRRDLDAMNRRRGRDVNGVSRLDLLEMERELLDAIDRRLARLERPSLTQVPQAPPSPPAIIIQQAPPSRPTASEPPAIVAPPTSRTAPTVEEVERAILETGLFGTTQVNFEFAKANLIPTATETLDVLADVLVRYPDLRIEVGGHTDSRGSDALNLRLSQRRAESVLEYLTQAGVSRSRLSAVGYGEARPVASNDNETGRALNRRVEFVVLNPEAARQTARPASRTDDLRQLIREELERANRSDSDG